MSVAQVSKSFRAILPGLLLAFGGALGFSGKAIIIKLAYRYPGVDAVVLILWRMMLALPLFLLLAWGAGRGKPPLTRRDVLAIWGLGFSGYYLASLLDFMGLAYISASLERLILYLGPTIVLALSVAFQGYKVTWRHGLALAVSYGGTVLVFGQELHQQGSHVLLGAALVFGSAISYAIYMVASGAMVARLGSLRLVGLASSAAAVFCIAHFLLTKPLSAALVPMPVVWLSVLNATACTVAPVLMVMMAIERLGAPLASQAGMIGPMATILLGVWILDEPFTPLVLVGTSLVLIGVWLLAKWR